MTEGQSETGNPEAGATVLNGASSDTKGQASVIFTQVGTHEVKATKLVRFVRIRSLSTSFLDF